MPSNPRGESALPDQNVFAPFTGFSSGVSDSSALALPDALTGDQAPTKRAGGEWGWHSQTIPVTHVYQSAHKSGADLREHLGAPGHLCWAIASRHLRSRMSTLATPAKLNLHPRDEPIRFLNAPSLARYLMSEEGRRTYGTQKQWSKGPGKEIKFAGVNKTPIPDSFADNDQLAITMAVQGRVRIQDPTCIYDVRAPANSDVWVIMMLEKWRPLWAPMIGDDDYDVRMKSFLERKDLATRERTVLGTLSDDEKKQLGWTDVMKAWDGAILPQNPMGSHKQYVFNKSHTDILSGTAEQSSPPDISGELSHYWKPCYWFGPRNHEPNPDLYINSDFVGHAEKLYHTHDLYGEASSFSTKAHAKEVFVPEAPTSKWQEKWVKLGATDAFLYMHDKIVW